jgi:hypothetical protein
MLRAEAMASIVRRLAEIEREGNGVPPLHPQGEAVHRCRRKGAQILDMARRPWIQGFTNPNPSLLKKAGVRDHAAYGRDLVATVPDRHISFEVISRHPGKC